MAVRKRPTKNSRSDNPGADIISIKAASGPDSQRIASDEMDRRMNGHAQWIFFAMASGACAAFNGVFAKLTTTELTARLSSKIAHVFGLAEYEKAVEFSVRGIFFLLNLSFNGVMWSLFTTALARGTSATQVSILNTSTNFLFTAMMGMIIFSEVLPPMWWAGASLLVAGSVIAGRKDEGENAASAADDRDSAAARTYEAVPGNENEEGEEEEATKGDTDEEDVLDLGDVDRETR